MTPNDGSAPALRKVLGPIHLWGIAVGLVISGDYFGWNYGLREGGPVGMVIATLGVSVMYVAFIFSFTELTTAIPQAGGPFAYATRALGPRWGFVAGLATLVEFVFAPPAIARAIGAYVNFRVPSVGIETAAALAFVVFGSLNAIGVSIAAMFELVVTALAAFELLLFFALSAPHVELSRIVAEPLLPNGWAGVFAAVPFAVWFYLAIEGVAMSAEEARNPKRDIPRGYLAGIGTLVVLALGTLTCTTGVLPWPELVKDDSPLPKVLASFLSADHPMTHLMVYLGLFGLVASFHGIILGYSRQVFALARARQLPAFLAYVHPRTGTPVFAILVPGLVGMASVFTGRTDALITLAGLGAVTMYVLSMVSLFVLRRTEPGLERPFVAPLFPLLPAIALAGSLVAFAAFAASNPPVLGAFAAIVGAGIAWDIIRPRTAPTPPNRRH